MLKLILNIIFVTGLSFCQIQYGGIPKYFDSRIDDLISISSDGSQTIDRNFDPMVFVYGDEYNMDVDVLESSLIIPGDDDVTYLLGIESRGAYGIGLNFDRFFLTERAELFIYD